MALKVSIISAEFKEVDGDSRWVLFYLLPSSTVFKPSKTPKPSVPPPNVTPKSEYFMKTLRKLIQCWEGFSFQDFLHGLD